MMEKKQFAYKLMFEKLYFYIKNKNALVFEKYKY